MKCTRWILITFLIMTLLVTAVSGALVKDKIIDDSAKQAVIVSKVPIEFKDKISITGADSTYAVTKDKGNVIISKDEVKGEHTKTKCSVDVSVIQSLSGYNGKEFAVLRVVEGQVVGYHVYKTKDILKGKIVTFDATFSQNILSGMTGTYTKTVSINTLNTTIPFYMKGGTGLRVLIDAPGTYMAFNETNISTYPDNGNWLVVWPLNGNAVDISGNGRNGAVTAATSTAGRSGAANTGYYFDGDNDYVSLDYPDTAYSANTLLIGYKLNHTTSDSNHIVADFRNPAGTGRTGMYEYETTWLVNNATSGTTLNSTTNQGWKYACYPFSPAQINYIWMGVRYSLQYDYQGWLDLVGLYNGTLSADQRRVFSYGYQGITVAPYPTATRTPIRSANQSVTPPTTMTGVNVQSPTSETKEVTIIGYMTQNATLVREWDNSTHHRVDMIFTAGSNITTGTLSYDMSSSDGMGAPALSTNASGVSVGLDNVTLTISGITLTTGQSKYFNVSLPSGTFAITNFTPADTTPSIPTGGSQIFNVTVNSSTNIAWLVNDSVVETDSSTTTGSYEYTGVSAGSYNVTAMVTGDKQVWILTVAPDPVSAFIPSDTTPKIKNGTIQQFKITYSSPVTVTWLLDNASQRTDNDTTITAYWLNASDEGLYNITARISGSQRTWDVNVTNAINTGSGSFVKDGIAVAIIVTIGYFFTKFRRRF